MAEQNTGPPVTAAIVGITDVGRVREHNEDSFLVLERDGGRRPKSGEALDVTLRTAALMVVCDGMGGAAAGEVASRMAADRVAQVLGEADLSNVSPDQIATLMDRAVQQANTEIFEKARGNADFKGMGTTLTAAVATPGRVFVSQVGDSRAYILRKGLLNQITKDQSLIGQLIEEGTLTEEEAEKLGGRNIVLQAVGVEETLRVDTKNWPMLRGDVLVICSDGLSGMVKDAKIREIVAAAGADLRQAAEKLVAEANANGGRDNVTVVLARFDGEGLRPPMETGDGPVETAGASFRAPPPPEVPNPMKKVGIWGGLLLALIAAAFFVFRPTTADIALAVLPAGARVELLDEKGVVLRQEVAVDGTVRVDGVAFGRYAIRASADHYFPQTTEPFRIEQTGNYPLAKMLLAPRAATLVVETKVPDVTVSVDVKSPHDNYADFSVTAVRLPKSGDRKPWESVPPGEFKVRAERPGFRPFEAEGKLDPDAERVVQILATDEIRGTLVVEAPPGFAVRVLTENGEPVATGSVPAEGSWSQQVRVGRLTVVATAAGYREFRSLPVELKEGATVTVRVVAEPESVRVSVRGRPNQEVVAEKFENGEWEEIDSKLLEGGVTTSPFRLEPGRWLFRYRGAAAADGVVLDLAPGAAPEPVDLEKGR